MFDLFIGLLSFLNTSFLKPKIVSPLVLKSIVKQEKRELLVEKSFNLKNRYPSLFVNQVFVDNMLLSLRYLKGEKVKREVDWNRVRQPFSFSFVLRPDEVFAFHNNLLSEFKNESVLTMKSHFIASEGYRSSGFLYGDGVCQLASLINWSASEAGLKVLAKVSHDFNPIPDIPREYGASIKYTEKDSSNSQNQNLYIKNNFSYPVEFSFTVSKSSINLKLFKL
jgi:hypothetical protein